MKEYFKISKLSIQYLNPKLHDIFFLNKILIIKNIFAQKLEKK